MWPVLCLKPDREAVSYKGYACVAWMQIAYDVGGLRLCVSALAPGNSSLISYIASKPNPKSWCRKDQINHQNNPVRPPHFISGQRRYHLDW